MAEDFHTYGFPDGKRYSSFVGYFKRKYGERLQKIVLDAGFTCPNRDGKVGRGGCTYCDNAAFHPSYSTAGKSLHQQLDEGIEFHKVPYFGRVSTYANIAGLQYKQDGTTNSVCIAFEWGT